MTETLLEQKTLLEVRNLKMYFPLMRGLVFQRVVGHVRAVDDISFAIERGQTLGLVGESGSGKTTIARTLVRLYQPTSGSLLFDGQDLAQLQHEQLRVVRRRIQMVFQSALYDWLAGGRADADLSGWLEAGDSRADARALASGGFTS